MKVWSDLGWNMIPEDGWLAGCEDRAIDGTLKGEEFDDFKTHMRTLVPVPWFHRGRSERIVYLERGGLVKPHKHPEWTLIYYAILSGDAWITVEGKRVPVREDMAIVLPPHVVHEVEPTTIDFRLSIAFRVFDHDSWNPA